MQVFDKISSRAIPCQSESSQATQKKFLNLARCKMVKNPNPNKYLKSLQSDSIRGHNDLE